MIEITKSMPVHKKCEKCLESCKQHKDLRIIHCPSFKVGGASKLEKC